MATIQTAAAMTTTAAADRLGDDSISPVLLLPANRVDRLVLTSLRRMSTAGRKEFIRRWKDDPGGYARWAVSTARTIEAAAGD